MRILHVISTLDPRAGGPTTAVVGLVEAQAKAGLEVSLLATFRDGAKPLLMELEKRGVTIQLIGPATGPLYRHPDLAAAVQQQVELADVVHIHAVWEEIQFQAARHARRRRIPYLITPHGMLTGWSLSQKAWKKRLYRAWRLNRMLRHAAAIHFTTQMEKDASAAIGSNVAAVVEPIGIALEEFENLPDHTEIRRRFPQLGDRPIVAFLGRIHPGKGLEYLVPAMKHIRGIEPALVIVGPDSGGYRTQIETLVAQNGLQERVLFTGMLKGRDRIEVLAGADLFVLPSDHENFGLAVIEALAAGTPVVISRGVGVYREIVDAGVGSAAEREPRELAREIARWLIDKPLGDQAHVRCREFVRQRFDWSAIARRWTDNYSRLIAAQ